MTLQNAITMSEGNASELRRACGRMYDLVSALGGDFPVATNPEQMLSTPSDNTSIDVVLFTAINSTTTRIEELNCMLQQLAYVIGTKTESTIASASGLAKATPLAQPGY